MFTVVVVLFTKDIKTNESFFIEKCKCLFRRLPNGDPLHISLTMPKYSTSQKFGHIFQTFDWYSICSGRFFNAESVPLYPPTPGIPSNLCDPISLSN